MMRVLEYFEADITHHFACLLNPIMYIDNNNNMYHNAVRHTLEADAILSYCRGYACMHAKYDCVEMCRS